MNKVKEIRKKMLLNQTEFGEIIGVCRQMVSNYENSNFYPSYKVIKRLIQLGEEHGVKSCADDFIID